MSTTDQKKRSSSYPSITINNAITLTKKINETLGKGNFKQDDIITALGFSPTSGTARRKASALIQYSLIEKAGNSTYKISSLSDRIIHNISEEDKTSAIIECAQSPKLFSLLSERFKGEKLPSLLENILIREFNIKQNAASLAKKIFIETMTQANLIDDNGKIQNISIQESSSKKQEIIENTPHSAPKIINQEYQSQENTYPVNLPSGIIILFPKIFEYNVALGQFSDGITALEEKAQIIKKDSLLNEKE
jgi:hypothetical protein